MQKSEMEGVAYAVGRGVAAHVENGVIRSHKYQVLKSSRNSMNVWLAPGGLHHLK